MDDKETKNIDGIKPPEQAQDGSSETINVNVTDTSDQEESADVAINSDGDIADSPDSVVTENVSDSVEPEASSSETTETEASTIQSEWPGSIISGRRN